MTGRSIKSTDKKDQRPPKTRPKRRRSRPLRGQDDMQKLLALVAYARPRSKPKTRWSPPSASREHAKGNMEKNLIFRLAPIRRSQRRRGLREERLFGLEGPLSAPRKNLSSVSRGDKRQAGVETLRQFVAGLKKEADAGKPPRPTRGSAEYAQGTKNRPKNSSRSATGRTRSGRISGRRSFTRSSKRPLFPFLNLQGSFLPDCAALPAYSKRGLTTLLNIDPKVKLSPTLISIRIRGRLVLADEQDLVEGRSGHGERDLVVDGGVAARNPEGQSPKDAEGERAVELEPVQIDVLEKMGSAERGVAIPQGCGDSRIERQALCGRGSPRFCRRSSSSRY